MRLIQRLSEEYNLWIMGIGLIVYFFLFLVVAAIIVLIGYILCKVIEPPSRKKRTEPSDRIGDRVIDWSIERFRS